MTRQGGRWSWWALGAILVVTAWWRGHTFGPDVAARTGLRLWPVVTGASEPLDCDEAAYGYVGRRLAGGAVMYRDLTENKPPLGYWIYTAAVAMGGANELTIRLLPLPPVLGTALLIFLIGCRMAGRPGAGLVACGLYGVLATDPFTYGNGAQLETMINLLAAGSLWAWIRAEASERGPSWRTGLVVGALVGASSLVRQVAVVSLAVFLAASLSRWRTDRGKTVAGLMLGFAGPWVVAGLILWTQGGLSAAIDDVFWYGRALATDTPPAPGSPSGWVRWVTGNADPFGKLPPPFGRTTYLQWWGRGTWPVWIVGVVGLGLWLVRGDRVRRIVAGWTCAAVVQVILPGLYWAHYYQVVMPGLAIVTGVGLGDLLRGEGRRWGWRRLGRAVGIVAILGAISATVVIQVRDYLMVEPEKLTVQWKGGAQWVELRKMGRDLRRRADAAGWLDPKILVWGWQSPLYFYSGLDGMTPQFFVDPLMKAFAEEGRHPQVRRRLERLLDDVRLNPPAVVFAWDRPFAGLQDVIERDYLPSRLLPASRDGRGAWVRPEGYAAFESGRPQPEGREGARTHDLDAVTSGVKQ
jgi:4-amino-4-deoxy-L-arabinose transferase-like glycosyltransferase